MSDKNREAVIAYVKTHLPDLLNRDVLIELLTHPDRITATEATSTTSTGDSFKTYIVETAGHVFEGKLVVVGTDFMRVSSFTRIPNTTQWSVSLEATGFKDEGEVLLSLRDDAVLSPGEIENYTGDEPLDTTIGRIVMNYLILVYPFGSKIPFQDYVWTPDKIGKIVSDFLIRGEITTEEVNVYLNVRDFIGHSPEIISPNLTRKAMTTAPDFAEKKKKIMEKYGPAIEQGDAVAMANAEAEMIAIDKDYIEGDESENYLLSGKQFKVIRKKLLLTHGMIESFGEPGEYAFDTNSLSEGWTQHAFPLIANELRSGSYSRARETAKGGEESKFILRVFQNTQIKEQDCGTTRTLSVPMHAGNCTEYVYRNYQCDGEIKTITDESAPTLVGRTVHLRSPMYCETKGGFCFTCMGKIFEKLDQRALATSVQNLSSNFVTASLKKTHGKIMSTASVANIDSFII